MRYAFVLSIVTGLATTLTYGQESQSPSARIDGYHEFNYGPVENGVEQWTQAIRVSEPELRSEIRGDVTVRQFDIEWAGNLKDGWTGVSGVQIVARPRVGRTLG